MWTKDFFSFLICATQKSSQHRDDLEDEELATNQLTEAMPTTIAGFKDHPLCVS
jgi:hypothetical protein